MGSCRKITVQPDAMVGLALLLLVMELKWVAAFMFSAAVHECCHLLALRLQCVPICAVSVGLTGAKIETPPLTKLQEFFGALAGPVGGLLLCLFAARFPRLAVCAFFHSAWNLLPLYPLDGGRALRCLVPVRAARVVEMAVIVLILGIAIRLTGIIGFLTVSVIVARPVLEKYLAKRCRNSYNSATIK